MTATSILIVSAIASIFLLFGGVLAWGDFYTRGERHNQAPAPKQSTAPGSDAPIVHRQAA